MAADPPSTPMPRRALVVGASRGLGRGVAESLVRAGSEVVTLSRTSPPPLAGAHTVLGDARDPSLAARLLAEHSPDAVVVVAGAVPVVRPLREQTWESLSLHWEADVRIAFTWLQEVLRDPLGRGCHVVLFSSGAALAGSPLSGGYAGAKATQRFLAAYARDEAERAGLGVRVTTVLPRITPATAVGRDGVRAYAQRAGITEEEYLAGFGTPPLTTDMVGDAVVGILRSDPGSSAQEYLLAGPTPTPLP